MNDISFTLLQTVSWPDAFLRVFLACAFGFFLGFDRSRKNKPIDFRVYMIVALTTCLVALMSQELYAAYRNEGGDILKFDLLRIVEGTLVGIGFLGTGAIIKQADSKEVHGTATGASIWSAGAIGLMLGFGLYGLAVLGFSALAVILILFGFLRKPLFNEKEINGDSDHTAYSE